MQIEKGIPIPREMLNKNSGIYRFEEWQVGDSAFFDSLAKIDSAQTSAKSWSKRNGGNAQFSRRKVDGGYRLWRIK